MDADKKDMFYAEQARGMIAVTFPLFTRTLFDTDFIVDRKVKTLCTNGEEVRFNPDFLEPLNAHERMMSFLHELVHVFLAHPIRFNPKVYKKEDYNLAADYAANALLYEAGLKLPSFFYFKSKFVGMSVEEIYKLVAQDDNEQFDEDNHGTVEQPPELDDDNKEGKGDNGDDDCSDPCMGKQPNDTKREEMLQESQDKMQADMASARMAGTLPDSLERMLKGFVKSARNWKDILAEMLVRTTGRDDFTYTRVNRRHTESEFIFPGMYSESSELIAVFVDTSGSIREDELRKMTGDLVSLSEDVQPERLIVMSCDTRIHDYHDFSDGFDPNCRLRGGGGTSFIPPFERMDKEGEVPEVAIYLTDGYCHRFPPAPEYPVIWVVWQDRHEFKPPFGDVVVMEGGI